MMNSRRHQTAPLRIALTYLGFGLLWIWITDGVLAWSGQLPSAGFWAAAGKGTLFVVVSTLLVYQLVSSNLRRMSQASALLRAVADGTSDAVFVKDREGKYLLFNQAAADFVGKSVETVLGQDDSTLYDAPSARRIIESDRQIMESGQATTLEEVLSVGGVTRTYLSMKAPYRDLRGDLLGIIGISHDITERKRANELLEEKEALARGILDSMTAHVAVLDAQGVITTVNEPWRIFAAQNSASIGPAPRTECGSNYLEVCRDSAARGCADAEMAAEGIRSVLSGEVERFTFEYACHSPREQRWFLLHVTPLGQRTRGVVVAHINITSRILGEESLRATERKFRELADAIPQIVWTAAPDGGLTHLNAKATEYSGLAVTELTDWSWGQVIHPDDLERTVSDWTDMLQSGIPKDLEFRIRRKDGQYRWHITRQVPTRNSAGQVIGWYGTCTDIEDLKQVEAAVRQSQEMLRLVLDNIPQGVFWKDRHSRYQGCNRVVAQAMGLMNSDAIVGKMNEDMSSITPEESAFFVQKDREVMDGDRPQHHILETITLSDGRTIWLDTNKVPLHDERGAVNGILGTWEDITERMKSEQALKDRERLLRIVTGAARVGLVVVSDHYEYLFANEAYAEIFGLDVQSIVGCRVPELLAAGWSQIQPRLDQALAGQPVVYELNLPGTSGDPVPRWYRVMYQPRTDDAGKPSVVVVVVDITEHKQAEKIIRESEERYRRLVDVLPDAIFINLGGRVVFCNPACVQLFGANERSEVIGKTPFELFHPECHDSIRARIKTMFETREPAPPVEFKMLRLDGQVVLVHVVATLIVDRGEEAILVCLHDLTERERSMQTLRTVMGSVNDAILTINDRGIVKLANPATEKLFGYSLSQVVGSNVSMLMPDAYRMEHDSYIANFIRTGVAKVIGIGREVEGRRQDGTTFPLELTVTEFFQGTERQFTGVVRDITSRKRLEAQFQQSQKMEAVGRLAGGIAHDFNNLLTIILGYSELMLEILAPDETHREWIMSIRDAGERASRLTQQLLAFSRKAIIEPKLLDLNELVDESAKLFRRLIGEDITFTLLADSTLPHIKADLGQIEQVIMNLVVNARDAMPNGGHLRIETRGIVLEDADIPNYPHLNPGRYVLLSVTDTGHGMPDEVKNKIFEPFFTTKGVGKGTGLGLAVVHGVITQCGGAITVESTVGVGTTFKLLFPIAQQTDAEMESELAKLARHGTETILLVEDEDEVRAIAQIALETQGFKVLTANNGVAALKVVDEYPEEIQLLVTDVVMPELGGRQLAEAMRVRRPGIRVLYMSGYTDDAMVHHGIVQATDAFIQKPFSPLGLARKARSTLDGNV